MTALGLILVIPSALGVLAFGILVGAACLSERHHSGYGLANAAEELDEFRDLYRLHREQAAAEAEVIASAAPDAHATTEPPRLMTGGDVDEVAVERAMRGEPVAVTERERHEAFVRLAARGVSDRAIAARLDVSDRTILRWRQSDGIESGWAM